MTQVSQFDGFDGINRDDIHVDNDSEYSGDEDREDEIRKALEAIGDETFDFDSEDSSLNGSRSSSVVNQNNNTSNVFSNQDTSHHILTKSKMNGLNNNSFTNGVNMYMLPNAVNQELAGQVIHPSPPNVNGKLQGQSEVSPTTNGYPKMNGNLVHASAEGIASKPKKHVTIVEAFQKNREHDEIEESNPTISLLHKKHCPRNDHGGFGDTDLWTAAENKEEQMKTLLEIRERQVHRGEEEISKLQKDKRSLNHQIGLMKTEMVQMKSQQEEAEKLSRLKEQECDYLKTKLREAIEEYERAKRGEITAQDQVSQMNMDIEKLKQEVQLLSSIGSSAKQAEVNDVVRQLREKHAADFVSWKKVVAELEGQLRTLKRHQQLLSEESFSGTKVNASSQTDVEESPPKSSPSVEIKKKEKTQIAILEDAENGDVLIKERKLISLNERFEELKREFTEEKAQLVENYEKEIEQYRHRLATLPNELYHIWEVTQKELGLQAAFDSRPICVDAFTSPMEKDEISIRVDPTASVSPIPHVHNVSVQVEETPFDVENLCGEQESSRHADVTSSHRKDVSSILVQTDDKETSNVVIQTDETLETYKVLAQLLESWSTEVQIAKAHTEEMTIKCEESEEELNKLRKQFKVLQKVATKCRKESKRREEALKKQNSEMKERHLEILQKLNTKLDVLA